MKKFYALLLGLVMTVMTASAFTYDDAARQAYYLTDKMAYELDLTDYQYDRVYQINLDYFLKCNYERDINGYLWEYRNAALARVLYTSQWRRYNGMDYFYRPLRWVSGAFHFIFRDHYPRHTFYRPTPPPSYKGPKPGDHHHNGYNPGGHHPGGDYRPGGNHNNNNYRPGGNRPGGDNRPGGNHNNNNRPGDNKPGGSQPGNHSGGPQQNSQPSAKPQPSAPQQPAQSGYRGGTRTSRR